MHGKCYDRQHFSSIFFRSEPREGFRDPYSLLDKRKFHTNFEQFCLGTSGCSSNGPLGTRCVNNPFNTGKKKKVTHKFQLVLLLKMLVKLRGATDKLYHTPFGPGRRQNDVFLYFLTIIALPTAGRCRGCWGYMGRVRFTLQGDAYGTHAACRPSY